MWTPFCSIGFFHLLHEKFLLLFFFHVLQELITISWKSYDEWTQFNIDGDLFSIQKNPPWRTSSNLLMHFFISFPLPKWGISSKWSIPVFTCPTTHCFGCNIGSHSGLVPRISMYTCCENFRNFLVSDTSWSAYLNLLMHPNNPSVPYTPYGMRKKNIESSQFLHEDLAMGCFHFLCVGVHDDLASGSLSSPPDSSCPMIYLSFTS